MALTAAFVFAAEDYNSSRSNTQTSIDKINEDVGNVLIRYAVGGAEINEVTDALVVGISTVDLKAMLVRFGVSDAGITEVFAELDRLGTGDTPQPAAVNSGLELVKDGVSAPDTGSTAGEEPTTRRTKYSNITLERGAFKDAAMNAIQNIKSAAPEERENLKEELKVSRETFKTEILSMSLSIRENAKELRENFRENVKTTIGHVDHGKTARIAVAHGKGLRMLNRFRSATARFDHILGRLESRIEKIGARGVDVSSVIPLIEEAKNISVDNEAKLEQLKEKYESLLLGENVKGIGEEARAIATEFKTETQNLHAQLNEIVDGIKACCTGDDYNSSRSNTR